MDTPKLPPPLVVNQADVAEIVQMDDAHWGSAFKPLTPALDTLGEQERRQRPRLGMNLLARAARPLGLPVPRPCT